MNWILFATKILNLLLKLVPLSESRNTPYWFKYHKSWYGNNLMGLLLLSQSVEYNVLHLGYLTVSSSWLVHIRLWMRLKSGGWNCPLLLQNQQTWCIFELLFLAELVVWLSILSIYLVPHLRRYHPTLCFFGTTSEWFFYLLK